MRGVFEAKALVAFSKIALYFIAKTLNSLNYYFKDVKDDESPLTVKAFKIGIHNSTAEALALPIATL